MEDLELAQALAEAVAAAGGRAYFVGGCVRDRLLEDRSAKDLDIEVHGLKPQALEEILDTLGTRLSMGESFGIYGLKGCGLDIAMPRKEHLRGRGHRDFDVLVDPFIGPKQAARRRDFTVNAMMADILTGEILDPWNGKADLKSGILRHVDDESFGEDPLRVLRGAQFAARFGFTLAPETARLCSTMDLSHLSGERVELELRKALLKAEKPSIFFGILRDLTQLDPWFPELKALIGVPQPPKFHGEGDVWNHTMLVLDQAAKLRDQAREPFWFMVAALCHDFGKAEALQEKDGRLHAFGHELAGIPLAEQFLNRFTREQKLIGYVKNMTQLHMKPNILAANRSSVKATNKLYDQSVCPEDLILLALADDRGRIAEEPMASPEDFLRQRLDLYREIMAKPHVMGRDLIAAGRKPGAEFSELLAYAHKLRLAGIEKDSALRQVLSYRPK